METEKIWTVSEVNSAVREVLEGGFMPFWMEGEVGTLIIHRSGHVYLTLKDQKNQIKAVFFGGAEQARLLKIVVGSKLEVFGRLTVYEVRGEYQFSIKIMRPRGLGELQRRFEELKNKLAGEGLFDQSRKKPIPILPGTIGVVTSPDGAAIRDFLQIINRRFPNMHIKIYPAAVQGKGAEKEISAGVRFFNCFCKVDVIIVTRGGGSLEDLWPFNEEVLAREIADSTIPVISAVGHEIDFTICDFVADMRVPTPSAAAELVIGKQEEFQGFLSDCKRRMSAAFELIMERFQRRYENAARNYVFREPLHILRREQQKLDEFTTRIGTNLSIAFERAVAKLEQFNGRLSALNPTAVLQRGYAILTHKKTGKTVTDINIPSGTLLKALLAKGTLDLSVIKPEDDWPPSNN